MLAVCKWAGVAPSAARPHDIACVGAHARASRMGYTQEVVDESDHGGWLFVGPRDPVSRCGVNRAPFR